MVLGKLSVPEWPAGLDSCGVRTYCVCAGCGWGCLEVFAPVYDSSSFSLSGRRSDID